MDDLWTTTNNSLPELICLAIMGLLVLFAFSILVLAAVMIIKAKPSEDPPPIVFGPGVWLSLLVLLTLPLGANAQPKFAQWIAVPGLQYNLYQAAGTNAFVVVTNLIVAGTNANVPLPLALAPGSYRFYATSISNGVESLPSNIFTVPSNSTVITGVKGTIKRSP